MTSGPDIRKAAQSAIAEHAMEEMHVVDWKIEMFGLLTKSNCPIPARLVWYQYYHVDT